MIKPFLCIVAASAIACGAYGQEKPTKPAAVANAGNKYQNVNSEAFDKLRRTDTNTVVLDVRTKEEYESGHIPGSVWIDFTSPEFEKEVAKLDKNKTYLVHCAGGGRSARACRKMEGLDFPKLFNLEGGLTAWEKAGKPVEKK